MGCAASSTAVADDNAARSTDEDSRQREATALAKSIGNAASRRDAATLQKDLRALLELEAGGRLVDSLCIASMLLSAATELTRTGGSYTVVVVHLTHAAQCFALHFYMRNAVDNKAIREKERKELLAETRDLDALLRANMRMEPLGPALAATAVIVMVLEETRGAGGRSSDGFDIAKAILTLKPLQAAKLTFTELQKVYAERKAAKRASEGTVGTLLECVLVERTARLFAAALCDSTAQPAGADDGGRPEDIDEYVRDMTQVLKVAATKPRDAWTTTAQAAAAVGALLEVVAIQYALRDPNTHTDDAMTPAVQGAQFALLKALTTEVTVISADDAALARCAVTLAVQRIASVEVNRDGFTSHNPLSGPNTSGGATEPHAIVRWARDVLALRRGEAAAGNCGVSETMEIEIASKIEKVEIKAERNEIVLRAARSRGGTVARDLRALWCTNWAALETLDIAKPFKENRANTTGSLSDVVPPRVKRDERATVTHDAMDEIELLLGDDGVRTILVRGEAGSGKSTLARLVEQRLWGRLDTVGATQRGCYLPVFIEMRELTTGNIFDRFKSTDLTRNDALFGRLDAPDAWCHPLFILEGLDEAPSTVGHNVLVQSRLLSIPHSKVLMTARSEFGAVPLSTKTQRDAHRTRWMAAFDEQQVAACVEIVAARQVAERATESLDVQWYRTAIKSLPGVSELVTNPFCLVAVVETLPELVHRFTSATPAARSPVQASTQKVSRWDVYEALHSRTAEVERAKIAVTDEEAKFMEREDLLGCAMHINEGVAAAMHEAQTGLLQRDSLSAVVEQVKRKQGWRTGTPPLRLAFVSGPNDRLVFRHKTVLEFYVAKGLQRALTAHSDSSVAASLAVCPVLTVRPLGSTDVRLLRACVSAAFGASLGDNWQQRRGCPHSHKSRTALLDFAATKDAAWPAGANALSIAVGMERVVYRRVFEPGANLRQAYLLGAYFSRCVLKGVTLDGAVCRSVEWNACEFDTDTSAAHCDIGVSMLDGHSGPVNSASYSPDGTRIVSASSDGTARVWDAATLECVGTLEGHGGHVNSASYSPDGTRVVSASEDGTARVWDAATLECVGTLQGHSGSVNSASYSPDGTRVVTASWDGTARVRDAATLECVGTLEGHSSSVSSASYSPDGTRIVSASTDGTARVWDAMTLECVGTLEGHTSFVNSASYSPDGTRIVTTSWGGTVRAWDAACRALVLVLSLRPGRAVVTSSCVEPPAGLTLPLLRRSDR